MTIDPQEPEPWERDALAVIWGAPVIPQVALHPTSVHGSKKAYAKHKCRCSVCVEAHRVRLSRKHARQTPEQREEKRQYLKEYRRKKRNSPEYDL